MSRLHTCRRSFATPRQVVRRNQARTILREIRRRGLRITRVSIEVYAIARYGCEPGTGHVVREVVEAAVRACFGATQPQPRTPRGELLKLIEAELERDPNALSAEVRERIESRGTKLFLKPSYFGQMVSDQRKKAGIVNPMRRKRVA